MDSPKVTVIMPIYNVAEYLDKCISSVLKQTYENYELFLIDDGSKDESPSIVDRFADMDKRIIPVHQKNAGVDAARNVGLNDGTGKYVAFIDSDDWYDEEYLERMVSAAEENECELVVCGFEPVGVNNPPQVKILEEGSVDRTEAMEHLLGYNSFNGYVWNKLFSMDIIQKKSIRFEDGYWACDDVLFAGNYIYYCTKVQIIKDKLYYYRQNNAGANRVRYSGKAAFDKKWLKSFEVTKHFDELFNDNRVSKACRLHEVREAGIILRSMTACNYRGAEYKRLRQVISKNWIAFIKSKEASKTQKLSITLTSFSPKLELFVWKKVNKV